MADIPFTSYAFPTTHGSEDRTLPERLADIRNIKDWGATGDGSTDDWEAIQDCIDNPGVDSVDLTVAVAAPHTPDGAVRATCTASRTGNAVSSLTITNGGTDYIPGQSYNVTFSGGGGTGAAATVTANGSGVIASFSVTNGGSGYTSDPTCTIEYPGRNMVLTFNSVPADLITGLYRYAYVRPPGTALLDTGMQVTAINTVAGTVTCNALTDGTASIGSNKAVIRDADLQVGDVVRFVKSNVGRIFVPPGTFRVSLPINFSGNSRSFVITGCGKASKIIGNFDDFVIKRAYEPDPYTGGQSGSRRVEKLWIENEHATGGGIRMAASVGAAIYDNYIVANRGITTLNMEYFVDSVPWGGFEMTVANNTLIAKSSSASSYGLALFHDGPTINNYVRGYNIGWCHMGGQGGQVLVGNTFEKCNTGIYQGRLPDATSSQAREHVVVGNRAINCLTGIRDSKYLCAANYVTAAQGQAGIDGNADPDYGFRAADDNVQNSVIAGNVADGWFSVASWFITGAPTNKNRNWYVSNYIPANTNGGGSTWSAISKPTAGRFTECNVARVYTYANLPPNTSTSAGANRVEGDCHNISNSNTAVWGASAAAGGANHVKVRANSSGDWIVIGK